MSRVLAAVACAIAVAALPTAAPAPALASQHHKHHKRHHHKKKHHHRRHCDPAYRGACLRPDVSDYDCAGGSGSGPYYAHGPIQVVGDDHYHLDADGDGVACES